MGTSLVLPPSSLNLLIFSMYHQKFRIATGAVARFCRMELVMRLEMHNGILVEVYTVGGTHARHACIHLCIYVNVRLP